MKKLLFLILIGWTTGSFAQVNSDKDTVITYSQDTVLSGKDTMIVVSMDTIPPKADTSEIKLGDIRIIIIEDEEKKNENGKNVKTHDRKSQVKIKRKHRNRHSMWRGLHLGVSSIEPQTSLTEETNFLELDVSRNRSFALNLFDRRFDLGTPYVGLATGLGLTFNRYAFRRNVVLKYDADDTWGEVDNDHNFDKNFLKTTHLTMPFLLELNTHRDADDGWRLAAGFELAYLLKAKTKRVYKADGRKIRNKVSGSYNLNAFRLSPMVMLGYRHIGLYGKVAVSPMFIEGKGPKDLFHTSLGLVWSFN